MNTFSTRYHVPSFFRHAIFASLFLLSIGSTTNADLGLTISQTSAGVTFNLQGSLDVGVFATPNSFFFSSGNNFSHFDGTTTSATSLLSAANNGTPFSFPNDTWLTPFGSVPVGANPMALDFYSLAVDPMFMFSYADFTGTGNDDRIVLPLGYMTGTVLNLSFTEPGATLSSFGLNLGDYWGVSFADSAGESQSLFFEVVPEPESLPCLGVLAAGLLLAFRRSSKS